MAETSGRLVHALLRLKILPDVHNCARYQDQLIGTPEVPNEASADSWQRLAAHYQDEAAILGFGLMNEPHDTGGRWPAAAQAAIDAIRKVDRRHVIFVCGDGSFDSTRKLLKVELQPSPDHQGSSL